MESSCPHCRSIVVPGSCLTVEEIRPIQQLVSPHVPEEEEVN